MPKGGGADYEPYSQAQDPQISGLDEEQLSNSQEGVPIPWLCGERRISLKWISRAYNQKAKAVKAARPAKK